MGGDGAPGPGDDAFELCRHLLGRNIERKHVSVVEGGWPAVETLACALKLDLMPLAEAVDVGDAGEEQSSLKKDLKEVAETAAAVTQHVAETAQRMWAGAGRLFKQRSRNS